MKFPLLLGPLERISTVYLIKTINYPTTSVVIEAITGITDIAGITGIAGISGANRNNNIRTQPGNDSLPPSSLGAEVPRNEGVGDVGGGGGGGGGAEEGIPLGRVGGCGGHGGDVGEMPFKSALCPNEVDEDKTLAGTLSFTSYHRSPGVTACRNRCDRVP